MAQNIGTLVGAAIRPADSNDEFPSAFANEIKGGHHSVPDGESRDSIPTERREFGMTCYVRTEGVEYRLVDAANGGIDNNIDNNENWRLSSAPSVPTDTGFQIISSVTFSTSGNYAEENQKVIAAPSPEHPLQWKYENDTFTITTPIEIPTSIDNSSYMRADAVVLTNDGNVQLLEGEELDNSNDEGALIYPSVPKNKHLLAYILWTQTGGGQAPEKQRLSEFINDVPFMRESDVKDIITEETDGKFVEAVTTGDKEQVYGVGISNDQKMYNAIEQYVSPLELTVINALVNADYVNGIATVSTGTIDKGRKYIDVSTGDIYEAFEDDQVIKY